MSAFVYAMRRASDGAIKIGQSVRPEIRLKQVSAAHGPCNILFFREVPADKSGKIERAAHQFASGRMIRGEWFRLADEEAGSIIDRAAEAVASGVKIDCSEAGRKRARIGRGIGSGGEEWERVAVPFDPELLARVEDYRFASRSPSRAAAVRDLIEAGLEAKAKAR